MSFDFEDDDFDVDGRVITEASQAEDYPEEFEAVEYYSEAEFRARGVDPIRPTTAKPGSEAKVLMLAARYAAGLPLWHDQDCYDHGPHLSRQN
jgi:hypothetical protein